MNYEFLNEFVQVHGLQGNPKLIKWIIKIGIEAIKQKLAGDISNTSIRYLAKSCKKIGGEERIRNEIENIRKELCQLTKKLDQQPKFVPLDTQNSPLLIQNLPPQIELRSEAKALNFTQPTSDIVSQEQLKWWSSPSQQIKKVKSEERQLPPKAAGRPKKEVLNLTPKVTESPAPQIQAQPQNRIKHHLDDSEIKKVLWAPDTSRDSVTHLKDIVNQSQSSQTIVNKPHSNKQYSSSQTNHEHSMVQSEHMNYPETQQTFHRQPSPRFKSNESRQEPPTQLPPARRGSVPKSQKKAQKDKENQKPAQSSTQHTQSSARKSVAKQQTEGNKKDQKQQNSVKKRRCWSITKKESNQSLTKPYEYVQSKIKDQIEYDRQRHKLSLLQYQFEHLQQNHQYIEQYGDQNEDQEQDAQYIHTETDELHNEPQDKQPTYTTFQMKTSQDFQGMCSNRNPIVSYNTRQQQSTGNGFGSIEEPFQYTMHRPPQMEWHQNDGVGHIRNISSLPSSDMSEATPVNHCHHDRQDMYSQATAQSVFLQSGISNNDKKTFSSGKGRIRSELRSNELSDRLGMTKLTSEKKQPSQRFSQIISANSHNREISSSFLNPLMKQLDKIQSTQSKFSPNEIDFENADDYNHRLRDILAQHIQHDYHSSISSNFSLFNPKDDIKSFFQKDYLEQQERQLSGRHNKYSNDNSSNVSFNHGSEQTNRARLYDFT